MKILNKAIVITTINEPNECIYEWKKKTKYNLVIVGDKKTPQSYTVPGSNILQINDQNEKYFKLSNLLPFNHYTRKNIGYVFAINDLGVDVIFDTDDDNYPLDNWSDGLNLNYRELKSKHKSDWVNIYEFFTKKLIWPRGFPVRLDKIISGEITSNTTNDVSISQGLVQGDPDVDAIYRLYKHDKDFKFDNNEPLYLSTNKNTLSPTNSQNTTFKREAFPLLYLPSTVTFRYTDILRGYVILALSDRWGIKVGFRPADVYQQRNEHDLLIDLHSELPMYNDSDLIIHKLKNGIEKKSKTTLKDDVLSVYEILFEMNIVKVKELSILKEWLRWI
jgi:hypothetical protein